MLFVLKHKTANETQQGWFCNIKYLCRSYRELPTKKYEAIQGLLGKQEMSIISSTKLKACIQKEMSLRRIVHFLILIMSSKPWMEHYVANDQNMFTKGSLFTVINWGGPHFHQYVTAAYLGILHLCQAPT